MAKCTCVWDGNRLTKPRFPSCSSWHLDSGWSDSHCSVNGQYQGVQAGLGVCTVSRSQGISWALWEWGFWLLKYNFWQALWAKWTRALCQFHKECPFETWGIRAVRHQHPFLWSWTFNRGQKCRFVYETNWRPWREPEQHQAFWN